MDFPVASDRLRLRPLEHADIETLRRWRNDPALGRFLTPLPEITPAMQEAWYARYTADDSQLLLVAEDTTGAEPVRIGTIALYDLAGDSAVCGRYMVGNADYRGKGFGGEMLRLCLRLAFGPMGLRALTCYAHPLNAPSLASWVNEGFCICGTRPFHDGSFEYELRLTAARWRALHKEDTP